MKLEQVHMDRKTRFTKVTTGGKTFQMHKQENGCVWVQEGRFVKYPNGNQGFVPQDDKKFFNNGDAAVEYLQDFEHEF